MALLPPEYRAYTGNRLEEIVQLDRDSRALDEPVMLTEGQLAHDPLPGMLACLAVANGQVSERDPREFEAQVLKPQATGASALSGHRRKPPRRLARFGLAGAQRSYQGVAPAGPASSKNPARTGHTDEEGNMFTFGDETGMRFALLGLFVALVGAALAITKFPNGGTGLPRRESFWALSFVFHFVRHWRAIFQINE